MRLYALVVWLGLFRTYDVLRKMFILFFIRTDLDVTCINGHEISVIQKQEVSDVRCVLSEKVRTLPLGIWCMYLHLGQRKGCVCTRFR